MWYIGVVKRRVSQQCLVSTQILVGHKNSYVWIGRLCVCVYKYGIRSVCSSELHNVCVWVSSASVYSHQLEL